MQHTNYAKLFESINNNAKYNMHVQFGTLKDYFALLDKHRAEEPQVPEFSTLSGDFFTYADRDDHYWSGYFTSRPFYKHMDRSLGHYLRSADLAFTLALIKSGNSTEKWAGIGEYDQLVEARRTLSLFQHHDGVTGTSVEYVVKDYARKLFVALFQCRNIIASATEYLLNMPNSALSVDEEHKVDVLPRKATVGSDAMVVVQNSLGYQREEVVCVQVNTTKTRVTKAGSDDAILQQIEPIVTADGKGGFGLSRDKFQLCFVASTPPFGFSRYELRESVDPAPLATLKSSFKLESDVFKTEAVKAESVQLSNGLITATFNARTGFLASIQTADASMTVDMSFVYYGARPHKYYFDFGGDHRSGAYLFLPDGDARPLPTDKNAFVVISGPVRQTIVVKGPDEIKLLQHVCLDINTAHLNIRNVVDIRSQGNFEAAMRLKTGIVENDRFYTELNGYQVGRNCSYQ
uniref:mannosyl-oligosaccharide 1,3-1,6-alpha-mannosidase n=1 Tax=Panagrellus redivivus TaxID=6233 RepID=A0A7E4UUL7_PANRE